jgi:NAD(P)-dependent dehydrogenase (short-subunit alcohol dehydrogenase family)
MNSAALVVGAGDAIGAALVRRFAREGLATVGVRRSAEKLQPVADELVAQGHSAYAWACDARKEEQVIALFDRVERELGSLEVVVFNIGANVPMPMLETPAQKFYKIWEMACFAGFLTGREAARRMAARGRGTIIFTGATASTRGAAGFGAFASAKAALRACAQSLAREMMPQGIHVAHVVVDAVVDTAWSREFALPMRAERKSDDIVQPDSLAELYWQIHRQPRDAWTFETDVRPWVERW